MQEKKFYFENVLDAKQSASNSLDCILAAVAMTMKTRRLSAIAESDDNNIII